MSMYQAVIFGTTFSLYTNMQDIYSGLYGFNSEQVGLMYLGPGCGFFVSVQFMVPFIDTIFNKLTEKHGGKSKPEYRLPLANIGAILIPVGLFWWDASLKTAVTILTTDRFAWTVHYRLHWAVTLLSTFFYGIGQVVIISTIQNYYIDSFEKYAASAIAAGAVLRSILSGVLPLLAPSLFNNLGYGWGISTFGFISIALAPAPMFFYIFGERIRDRFATQL
jgi:hypothetical protein